MQSIKTFFASEGLKSFFKNYFTIEVISVLAILILCLFLYFKYEHGKIKSKINFFDEFDDLYNSLPKSVKKKKTKKVFKHEEKCREILEELTGEEFPSCRPDFLKNPVTKKNLELDGYCEKLKMAFEYDGIQHSKYSKHFHKGGAKEFIYQTKKDDFKTKKCKELGIKLIRIPHYIHYNDLKEYVKLEYTKLRN